MRRHAYVPWKLQAHHRQCERCPGYLQRSTWVGQPSHGLNVFARFRIQQTCQAGVEPRKRLLDLTWKTAVSSSLQMNCAQVWFECTNSLSNLLFKSKGSKTEQLGVTTQPRWDSRIKSRCLQLLSTNKRSISVFTNPPRTNKQWKKEEFPTSAVSRCFHLSDACIFQFAAICFSTSARMFLRILVYIYIHMYMYLYKHTRTHVCTRTP